MKIIYYSPHPHLNMMSAAGYGTHIREMITAFKKEGCRVLPVIMGGEDNPPEQKLTSKSGGAKESIKERIPKAIWRTLKDINLLRFDHFRAVPRLRDAIKEFEPDCIYERGNYLQLSGIRMAKKYEVMHVMELNSPYVDQKIELGNSSSYLEKYARRIEKKQVTDTRLPVATVGPLRDYFCERYDIKPDRFMITHDAFNEENIKVDSAKQQKIIDSYNLEGKIVVGFVGSIFKWHGLDKLIRAFAEVDRPNVKLLIVGYGAYMVELMDLTKNLGMEDDVIFTGSVPKEEVFDYINIMDICTAPSAAWYQSPVKIFEYGAMGKPILGPDTNAVREVMEDGKDGLLVKPTIEDVKKALQNLLDDSEKRGQMGRHFQKKVLNDYTWKSNARRVLNALNSQLK